MYLISIYFDDVTNKKIQGYMEQVAKHTGNFFMLDEKVPPHLTVSAFDTRDIAGVIPRVEKLFEQLFQGDIKWVSLGQFLPYVLFLSPVLDEYLHGLASECHQLLSCIEDVKENLYYQPFQWLPHTTIGKTLSKQQMKEAFEVMQNSFGPFAGKVTEIGLAKTNPHEDIIRRKLRL